MVPITPEWPYNRHRCLLDLPATTTISSPPIPMAMVWNLSKLRESWWVGHFFLSLPLLSPRASSPPISNYTASPSLTRRIHWHLLAVLPCLLLAVSVADGQELLVQFRLPDLRWSVKARASVPESVLVSNTIVHYIAIYSRRREVFFLLREGEREREYSK